MNSTEKLIDHIREFPNALGADLETGSHHSNNFMHTLFAQKYRSLMEWAKQVSELADAAETTNALLVSGLREASRALTELDPLANTHNAALIDDAQNAVNGK